VLGHPTDSPIPELTRAELRLLPLLGTPLSLNEIAQALGIPREVVMALARSVYRKLGPVGEVKSGLTDYGEAAL
jgi:DNA-binding CsgD family transcriptional regulator